MTRQYAALTLIGSVGIVIRHVSKTALPEQCAEVVCAYKMRRLREAFRMLKIPVAEYIEGSPQHDDPFG